jgi:hypothetical protein
MQETNDLDFVNRQKQQEVYWLQCYNQKKQLEKQTNVTYDEFTQNAKETNDSDFVKRQKQQELYWLQYYNQKKQLEKQNNVTYDEITFAKMKK